MYPPCRCYVVSPACGCYELGEYHYERVQQVPLSNDNRQSSAKWCNRTYG